MCSNTTYLRDSKLLLLLLSFYIYTLHTNTVTYYWKTHLVQAQRLAVSTHLVNSNQTVFLWNIFLLIPKFNLLNSWQDSPDVTDQACAVEPSCEKLDLEWFYQPFCRPMNVNNGNNSNLKIQQLCIIQLH